MKGDIEALFELLDSMIKDLDEELGEKNEIAMRAFRVHLDYNSACAAHFALKKLISERNKVKI